MEWLAVVRCGKKFAQSFVLFFFGTESLVRVAQTQQRKRRYPPPTETLPPPSPKNKTKTKRQKDKNTKNARLYSPIRSAARNNPTSETNAARAGPGRARPEAGRVASVYHSVLQ